MGGQQQAAHAGGGDAGVARQSGAIAQPAARESRRSRAASAASVACSPLSRVPGGPNFSAPSVRKIWRVITLLLNLLTDRMTSASGGDWNVTSGVLPAGHLALAHPAGDLAALLLPEPPERAVGKGRAVQDRAEQLVLGALAGQRAGEGHARPRGRAADDHADAALAPNRSRP